MSMRILTYVLLAVSAAPLVVYPGVLLAGVMGLGAPRSGREPPLLVLVVRSFLYGSIAYPLVFCLCAKAARGGSGFAALAWAAVPVAYLAALWLLMQAWERLGKQPA